MDKRHFRYQHCRHQNLFHKHRRFRFCLCRVDLDSKSSFESFKTFLNSMLNIFTGMNGQLSLSLTIPSLSISESHLSPSPSPYRKMLIIIKKFYFVTHIYHQYQLDQHSECQRNYRGYLEYRQSRDQCCCRKHLRLNL